MPIVNFMSALVIVVLILYFVNRSVRLTDNTRSVVNVVLGLLFVGMLLWLINTYVPMAKSIKAILNIVVVVTVCVRVLQALGLWDDVTRMWDNLIGHRTLR